MPKMTAAQKAEMRGEGTAEFDAAAEAAQREAFDAKANPADEEVVHATIEPDEPDTKAITTTKAAPRARATKTAPIVETSLFVGLDDTDDKYNILLWGREGAGKTSDALSAANKGRVLVFNAEGGLKKIALKKRGINTDNIFLYPKPGEAVTYEGMDEAIRQVKSDLMDDPNSWFALIVDSATEVSESLTGDAREDRNDKTEAKKGDGFKLSAVDSFFTDRADYGTSGSMMRDLLRKMRDLQCHLIITALERRDVDEDTSKVAYGPAVPPGLQKDILGYVDIVLYCKEPDEERDVFRALTRKAGKFRAKDRLDMLPTVLVNPTVERILAYVNEELTEATDPLQAALTKAPEKKAPPKSETAAQRRVRLKKEAEEDAASEAQEKAATPA